MDRLAARGVVLDRHYRLDSPIADQSPPYFPADPDVIETLAGSGVATIYVGDRPSGRTGWVYADTVARADHPSGSLLPHRRALYETISHLPPTAPALIVVDSSTLLPPWAPPARWLSYYLSPNSDDPEPLQPWWGPLPSDDEVDDHGTYERVQSTFAAAVSNLDRSLTRLLAGCRTRGFGKESLIIVTGTAGLPLGEDGSVGPAGRIVDAAIHMPCLIRLPHREAAGKRVSTLTSSADIDQLIARYFQSSTDNCTGTLFQDSHEHLEIRGSNETAVITSDRLLVRSKEGDRLYLLPDDPWQASDVATQREDDVAIMAAILNRAAN
ncbi:MAG: hypothetical protein K1X57_02400 [Gemmataceae bacterium]|nr:hypothetical protein [Gemmataceae bacterium]